MPKSVTSIGNGTFRDCKSLAAIDIPTAVITIGDGVFLGCKNLNITVEKQNPRFSDIDGALFDKIEKRILFSVYKRKEV
jgi:hypothetical protein